MSAATPLDFGPWGVAGLSCSTATRSCTRPSFWWCALPFPMAPEPSPRRRYAGRLAPVRAPRRGVVGDLREAMRDLPSRRLIVRGGG